ncbi:response regulator transcription factor [Leisingera sp.]|uniref:response regulator transcription factor n=1 Tax=Leisingera sp. TaxID=1879318 RepID=UPI002B26EA4C|nr:response regulator transcription factor [Leisingera sp.]
MAQISVLVVDDEPDVRNTLRTGLAARGWMVFEAWNRKTLFAGIGDHNIDIVTLDLKLGREDGLSLARELRRLRNVPILMISGKTEPFDRVQGLENGADDYVVKPFHIREVILRIETILERYRKPSATGGKVMLGQSELDKSRGTIRHPDTTTVELTSMELQLMELFLRYPGRVLSRDDISNVLYGRDWAPLDRSIDGHVARLRRKVEKGGEAPVLIRSVRGVGYVFSSEADIDPQKC